MRTSDCVKMISQALHSRANATNDLFYKHFQDCLPSVLRVLFFVCSTCVFCMHALQSFFTFCSNPLQPYLTLLVKLSLLLLHSTCWCLYHDHFSNIVTVSTRLDIAFAAFPGQDGILKFDVCRTSLLFCFLLQFKVLINNFRFI